eukprot:708004-Pleurochrysis_carterae.AAC.1
MLGRNNLERRACFTGSPYGDVVALRAAALVSAGGWVGRCVNSAVVTRATCRWENAIKRWLWRDARHPSNQRHQEHAPPRRATSWKEVRKT